MAAWSLGAFLLLAAGSPPLQAQDVATAPADRAAFDALVIGQRLLSTLAPASLYHVDFVEAGRFEETEGSTTYAGSYSYTNTGPDTGAVVFNYDDGDSCTYSVTFETPTAGSLTYTCTEGETGGSDWRLVDDPDYVPVGAESFSIPNLGGWSVTSNGTEADMRSGYGRIRAEAGSNTPSGIAIFGYNPGGTLISEAGVPATEAVRQGRIFAEVNGPVNTGLAIANPNDAPATILFHFTDTEGVRFGEGSFELGAREQTARFLNETPFNSGEVESGTFTFTSSVPIAVIALRGLTNRDGEFLMTTLPVAPLASTSTDTVYFPHFTDGSGWVTQVILVNPTDETIAGKIQFVGQGSATAPAAPAILTLDDGRTGSEFPYSIPAGSSQRFITSNPPGGVAVGSVRAIPDDGYRAPSGLVVFSFTSAGKTVLEAGVSALAAGSAFRVYVESSGLPEQIGSIRTGLAITNAAGTANTVTLEVTDLDGTLAAPPATLPLPPSGQVARFIDEFFDSLPPDFSGVLRVTSTADVAIVGLRLRYNDRGELKMTTTPPSIETGAPTMADRFFPHIVDSAGWSTQFILFSGTAGEAASGTLSYFDTAGEPWDLPTESSVSEGSPPGGGAVADLVVQSPTVSDANPDPAESFTFSATVRNQGTGQSTATTLRYYRSTDAAISATDTEVGTDAVGGLAAAASSDQSITLTAPSTAGTYYYGACVDPVSGETDAGNNCSNSSMVTVSSASMTVIIPDANLRAEIEADLGKASGAPITAADMEKFTHLSAQQAGISDLTGLESAANLTVLHLGSNNISDPSPLADLTNLTELRMDANQITDVSPLAGLTNLTDLYLGWNNISDPSPLANLSKLKKLDLQSNNTSNLSFLPGLTDLTMLVLASNGITDISPLSGLTNLTELHLDSNGITDISPLSGLTNLTDLYLGWNNISDPSPLAGLTKLKRMDLQSNNTPNLSFLASLTNLEYLSLGFNGITNISPISGLTNLTELWMYGNRITDVSPLAGLTQLTNLIVWGNNITDISPLAGLVNLSRLVLSNNPIANLSPLEGLTNLTNLSLFGVKITNLSTLASWLPGRTNLERLNLGATGISDISMLAGLANLRFLHLGRNNISGLSPLSGLTNLTELSLLDNNIADVSPLAGLNSLITLRLGTNDLTDVSALGSLVRLSDLELEFNRVTDISALTDLTRLTRLDLRGNPLSDSSINDHIPALESGGASVFFDSFRNGDYDIDLVFSDAFTERQKGVLQYVARRWMAVIAEDLPDYEFTQSWSGTCGDESYEIPAGERIDDLRIYIGTLEEGGGVVGRGGPFLLRQETHLPVLGCMSFDLSNANFLTTGLHEIGHVLGFGTIWDELGFLQDRDGDTHFNGPLAIAAFDEAGGSDYTGAKVPLERMDGSHWRVSVFPDELMRSGGGSALSAITVQSMADLGYGVDVTQADPYTLPGATSAQARADTKTAIASIPADDPLTERLGRAEPVAACGFDLRDSRLTKRLAPPSQTVPMLSCGLDLGWEPIESVDQLGRIIRALGN